VNWTHFSKLSFTKEVHNVITALDLTIPPDGRPHVFLHNTGDGQFFSVKREGPDRWLITTTRGVDVGLSSQFATDEVKKQATTWFLSKGTPSGDALRYWLNLWEEP
jgi:hypothetical protein